MFVPNVPCPVTGQSLSVANYIQTAAIGGDVVTKKLFWDIY